MVPYEGDRVEMPLLQAERANEVESKSRAEANPRFLQRGVGRRRGVGRDLGVGTGLGMGVGVAVGVGVGVGVGVTAEPSCTSKEPMSIRSFLRR